LHDNQTKMAPVRWAVRYDPSDERARQSRGVRRPGQLRSGSDRWTLRCKHGRPHNGFADRQTNGTTLVSYTDRRGLTERVSGTQRYDRLRQVKTETAYRRWWDADGQEVVRCAPLMLRYTFPKVLEALLHYNGFTVTDRFGDWDGGALTGESGQLICVCRKTR
jgi:hypothetical protein